MRHNESFVVEEISLFAGLLPIAWLFTLMFGHKLFDRLRRGRGPGRLLIPTPAE